MNGTGSSRLREFVRGPGLLPRVLEVAALILIVLAVGVGIVTLVVSGSPWLAYVGPLCVLAGVGLSYRAPYLGLLVVAIAPVFAWLSGSVPEVTGSAVCFAGFLFALRGSSGLLVGAVLAVSNFVFTALRVGTIDVSVNASASIFAFAAIIGVAMGSAVHSNSRYRIEAEARIRETEASRLTAIERGVAQERLRIARDLHDSVGHQIAVVNMHLGAAEVHLTGEPASVRADLEAARQGVQGVLRETQQILRVLRISDVEAPAGPTPDHTLIADLIASYQAAGMRIEASISDVDATLRPQASVAAYRIVQEALTNAQKHGDGSASVTVREDETGTVTIEVVNMCKSAQHPAGPALRGGNGIVGMRERAALVGGTVEATSDGSLFWVTARIPSVDEVTL